jgi:hypothetical protein
VGREGGERGDLIQRKRVGFGLDRGRGNPFKEVQTGEHVIRVRGAHLLREHKERGCEVGLLATAEWNADGHVREEGRCLLQGEHSTTVPREGREWGGKWRGTDRR